MSFVNLLDDRDWSDTDILDASEAWIAARLTLKDEAALVRKAIGVLLGPLLGPEYTYEMTPEEVEEAKASALILFQGQALRAQARAAMALKRQIWAVEAAQERLSRPVVELGTDEGVEGEWFGPTEDDVLRDQEERATAQAIVDGATSEVMELVALRASHRASTAQVEQDPVQEESGE